MHVLFFKHFIEAKTTFCGLFLLHFKLALFAINEVFVLRYISTPFFKFKQFLAIQVILEQMQWF